MANTVPNWRCSANSSMAGNPRGHREMSDTLALEVMDAIARLSEQPCGGPSSGGDRQSNLESVGHARTPRSRG